MTGTTAVHLCFGYAQMVKANPPAIRSVTSNLAAGDFDRGGAASRPAVPGASSKTVILGVIDLSDLAGDAGDGGRSIRAALPFVPPERISSRRTAD